MVPAAMIAVHARSGAATEKPSRRTPSNGPYRRYASRLHTCLCGFKFRKRVITAFCAALLLFNGAFMLITNREPGPGATRVVRDGESSATNDRGLPLPVPTSGPLDANLIESARRLRGPARWAPSAGRNTPKIMIEPRVESVVPAVPLALDPEQCSGLFDNLVVKRLIVGAYSLCDNGQPLDFNRPLALANDTALAAVCYRISSEIRQDNMVRSRVNTFCTASGTVEAITPLPYAGASSPWRINMWCPAPTPLISIFSRERLPRYMYQTGLGNVLQQANWESDAAKLAARISADTSAVTVGSPDAVTIMLQRDGPGNLYHFINEAFSVYITRRVLNAHRGANVPVHVVVTDGYERGPYWDVWGRLGGSVLSLQQPEHRGGMMHIVNPVWPLAGGDSPFWAANWPPIQCNVSDLATAFASSALEAYGVKRAPVNISEPPAVLRALFIQRNNSRRLLDQDALFAAAERNVQLPEGTVLQWERVSFEHLSFREQLTRIQTADVLVGVHGAGFGHGIWMHRGSVLLEVFPYKFSKMGFRNLAMLVGVGHVSLASQVIPNTDYSDYHAPPVSVEASAFCGAMQQAVNRVLVNKYGLSAGG